MIDIRPVSDLRNHFGEIEAAVQSGKPVYLTKNGYGSMVVMSIEAFSDIFSPDIPAMLDEADRLAESDDTRLSHEEMFQKLRSSLKCTK